MTRRHWPMSELAADELARAVARLVGARSREDVECPRERSFMTPCIARDGASALDDGGFCVGCHHRAQTLWAEFQERHPS